MLLGSGTVGGDVGILRGLKVWSPPVGHHISHCPVCLDLTPDDTALQQISLIKNFFVNKFLRLTPSSLPRVLLTILSIPSVSVSPIWSSPLGSLKKVVPEGLGPGHTRSRDSYGYRGGGRRAHRAGGGGGVVGCARGREELPPPNDAYRTFRSLRACG